jgi:hypothetical protein
MRGFGVFVLLLGCEPAPVRMEPTRACVTMLSCAAEAAPLSLPSLQEGYGRDGACWRDASSSANCDVACQSALKTFRQSAPDAAGCGCERHDDCYDPELRCVAARCVTGLGCVEWEMCHIDCADDACRAACREAASPHTEMLLVAIDRCRAEHCAKACARPESATCRQCVDSACTDERAACYAE